MGNDFLLNAERKARLDSAIRKFPGLTALVIGDLMLDVFIWGEVRRISPEAPVPVVEVSEQTKRLGGAANVAHNLATLGARVLPAGLVGDDSAGMELIDLFRQKSISSLGIIEETGRSTSVKTRVIARNQQVVRYDLESRRAPASDCADSLNKFIRESLAEADVVVVSDYAKGVVSAPVLDELRRLCGKVPVVVDPKVENIEFYRRFTIVTPNHHEAARMSGIPIENEESLNAAGFELLRRLECENLLITRGKDGMSIFRNSGQVEHIPTLARQVYDVTGAGDTVAAVLALGTAAGLSIVDASILANFAAGIVVAELGTAVVSAEQLARAVNTG